MSKYSSCKGITFTELCVTMGIFSLFIFAFYATLEVGLKTWKMGEVRADLQSVGEVLIRRLANDIADTNADTLEVNDPNSPAAPPFLCFETARYNGQKQLDSHSQKPLWQGHIIYYALDDPEDSDYNTKNFYKRYIPHNKTSPYYSDDRLLATFLSDIPSYLYDSTLTATELGEGQTLKKVCNRVSKLTLKEQYGTVDITVILQENFRKSENAKVMFSATGNDNIGTEKYVIQCTIRPRH